MKPRKAIPATSIKAALIAPCGMNCGLCWAYVRDKNACLGCLASDEGKSVSCARCRIKNCETRKTGGFKHCFACAEFPCARLKHLDKRYRTKYAMSTIANLEHIREFGIRDFVKREKVRWTCPQCGRTLSVHKRDCVFCGHKWRSRE